MPATLTLRASGTALHNAVLPRLAQALEAGESVWYLVPDKRARSARLRAVARRVCVLEPPLGIMAHYTGGLGFLHLRPKR